jgi:RNA polymerase sigma factor for flagellar operon FliA
MTATAIQQSSSSDLTDALWARYRASGDAAARTELLDRYVGLVYHVAHEVGARTPAVEVGELVSAGTLGLVKALDSFDCARGLAFSTYAVRRIRGAMLDDLRGRDWAPRSVRAKSRKVAAATATLQGRLKRAPKPQEVAAALDIDLETYWKWRDAIDGGVTLPLDGAASKGPRDSLTLEEVIDDADAALPGHELLREEQVRGLKEAIANLPEQERTVLALYYYEELNLRQIGEVLHVTESRVSQIRAKALRRLRDRLTEDCG